MTALGAQAAPKPVTKELLSPEAGLASVYKALVAEQRRQWRPSLAGVLGLGLIAGAAYLFRTRR